MALVLSIVYIIIRVSLMASSLQGTLDEVTKLQTAAEKKDLAALSVGLGKASDAIAMADSAGKPLEIDNSRTVSWCGKIPCVHNADR